MNIFKMKGTPKWSAWVMAVSLSFLAAPAFAQIGLQLAQGQFDGIGMDPDERRRYLGFDPDADAARYLQDKKSGVELPPGRLQETKSVRIAQQYGLGYLPLMVIRQYRLIEKHTRQAGLGDVSVAWSRFPSAKAMEDALGAGLLDLSAGGVVPLLLLWDRSQGETQVHGMAALASMPMFLNSRNAQIAKFQDLSDKDRIALPAVKVSNQAVVLQMAAAQAYGYDHYDKLDSLTVSMKHPDAAQALLRGDGEITAHFASPPFQNQELGSDRIHTVVDSYGILGGPSSFSVLWTTSDFRDKNPRTYRAILAALQEAVDLINTSKREAARVYSLQSGDSVSVDFIEEVISDPAISFGLTPQNVMKFADFMYRTGALGKHPGDWRALFFPEIHAKPGS